MNVKRTGILMALAICLAAISACEQKVTPQTGPGRVLEIRISTISPGQCDVDYPKANLRKKLKHRLKWTSEDAHYTVIFQSNPPGPNPVPGTPFQDGSGHPQYTFDVPAGGAVETGEPVGNGYYEYSINDANNKECANAKDPGIVIKP